MANTVYTIHAAANHVIVAVYEFEGNVGIDHAYPARQVAMDQTDGKTRRFYLHNGVGVIAAFMVRNGEAHEILRNDYVQFGDRAKEIRAAAGHAN